MSVYREIDASIKDARLESDGSISGKASFAKDFIGFQGHFPDNPIVPGICLMDAIKILLERVLHKKLEVTEILSVKFFNALGPEEDSRFNITFEENDGKLIAKSEINCDDRKISISKIAYEIIN